jgi:hypothetical protein
MAHTNRNIPESGSGLRHPHTLNELKQIEGILADDRVYNTKVSGLNHMRKRKVELPTSWEDIPATSLYQEDHH